MSAEHETTRRVPVSFRLPPEAVRLLKRLQTKLRDPATGKTRSQTEVLLILLRQADGAA